MKPVSFSELKKLRKMTLNDFNRWITVLYECGFNDGIEKSEEGLISEVDEEQLFGILISVKGIGEKRAREAVDKIMRAGKRS